LFVLTKRKGGVWRYVSEISKALKKKGVDVEILSRDEDLKTNFFGSFLKLRKAIRRKKYDVLMAEDWSIALPLLGTKNLFCTFNALSPNFPANLLQKFVYILLKDKVIVVSEYLKKFFPRAHVVEEGVNLDFFKPKRTNKKARGFFLIGFAQNKQNPSYRYNLVKAAIEKMKGAKLVCTGGKLTDEEVVDFYNSLDAFISIPDGRAGFNLCWLEAMACNIPTIGNNHGIGEKLPIIKVPEPPTEEDIVKAIKKAMKIRKVNYREWIKKKGLTWERAAEEMMKVLKKFLKPDSGVEYVKKAK